MNALEFAARLTMLALSTSPMPAIAQTMPARSTPAQVTPARRIPNRPAAPQVTPTGSSENGANYVLGSGDRLRVTVFGEPQLSGEFAVSDAGIVSLPLIGDIPAGSRTLTEVQELIRARLATGYLNDPRVALEVISYRTFFILGEVNKPGEYPYRSNLRLEQAVATAGGYSYRANRRRFVIVHENGDETEIKVKQAGQLRIQPGDTIRILERFF